MSGRIRKRRAAARARLAARRGVDVDDRRIQTLGDVGERNSAAARPSRQAGVLGLGDEGGVVADIAGAGVIVPAMTRPDEKRDRGGKRDRLPRGTAESWLPYYGIESG